MMRAAMSRLLAALASFSFLFSSAIAADVPTRSLDPRLEIRLFAESPQIVTPTGIDVDSRGRVWAIESNTHHRQPSYQGYPSDRVLVFRDDDGDGKADRVDTFADGFTYAMSVAARFGNGVYVVTRGDVFHLTDANNDGKADSRRVILHLDTRGDYPHNGLAGLAMDGLGNLYVGLGENMGLDYRLVGSDGRSHAGGGEGGSVFRFRPDGSDLTLWATGFWNPHASCIDAFGRMFTVDNDPDDRPPCRLLNLIPGGDYGYRYRNGRRGIHPFTAWDGELPGTLPMVAGTGEAPSGIVAYESDALPEEYRGSLLVTSWGDHRIDRFQVHPQGASLTSKAEPIIVGGENFRPVGVALAPDGSLFATDWVSREYHVHGKGRIWRIAPANAKHRTVENLSEFPRLSVDSLRKKLGSARMDVRRIAAENLAQRDRPFLEAIVANDQAPARQRAEATWALARSAGRIPHQSPRRSSLKNPELRLLWPECENGDGKLGDEALLKRLGRPSALNPPRELLPLTSRLITTARSEPAFLEKVVSLDDRFVLTAVVQSLTDLFTPQEFADRLRPERTPSPRARLALLLAARQSERQGPVDRIPAVGLRDPDLSVRRTAVQWVGEEKIASLRPEVEKQLALSATTTELFDASLAALEMLDGRRRLARDEFSGADYAVRLVRDENASPDVRARALRMVPPNHKGLNAALLKRFVTSPSASLRAEAVRTLRETTFAESPEILRRLAGDDSIEASLRLDAVAGLAACLQREGDHPDRATLELLRRQLVHTDRSVQIEALRALRRSLKLSDVRADMTALGAGLNQQGGTTVERREQAEQVALAFRMAGLPLPSAIDQQAAQRPPATAIGEWVQIGTAGGDAANGRRIFEHPNGPGCFRCHTVNGRGGKIGPDLSVVARSLNREKLAESILRPSKEIAPQFTAWTFVTRQGRTFVGLVIAEDRNGSLRVGTPEGDVREIKSEDLEERHPQSTSIMPERLVDSMTNSEFRDLIAFLATLK